METSDSYKLIQVSTPCLAQYAYYIESEGEAVVIDPTHDSAELRKILEERKPNLKFILETHFHADFLSGNSDLTSKYGAKIVYGPSAKGDFDFHEAKDGEEFKIGKITLKVLHTPGHTLESTCYLLIDENDNEKAIFTGDTVFLGTLGRPDLAVSPEISSTDLAAMLYESVHSKILSLQDDIVVFPGHGAGSSCGKNISSGSSETLGNMRHTNPFFSMDKEAFIKEMVTDLGEPPKYFFHDATLNKKGNNSFDSHFKSGFKAVNPSDLKLNDNLIILDTRDSASFSEEHIESSVFISLDMPFAKWLGSCLPADKEYVLICPEGREEEAVMRMVRIGYTNIKGYIKGGLPAAKAAGLKTSSIRSISPDDAVFKIDNLSSAEMVLDVREEDEFANISAANALNVPLSGISNNMDGLKSSKDLYVYCAGGNRSVIAASILKRNGYKPINVKQGFRGMALSNVSVAKKTFSILRRFAKI